MRIAISNDTPLAVEALKLVVLSVPEYEIAWIAENGEQAVKMAKCDVPDLILMDIYMPVMDGVEATRKIMQQSACAILVVTSDVNDHSGKVFDAMGAGALDAVNTPVLVGNHDLNGVDEFLKKLATLKTLINPSKNYIKASSRKPIIKNQTNEKLLVIGASTGGPNALATILAGFPADFPVPIVIVQHVDIQFVQGFNDWLNKQISLTVVLAKNNDKLAAGTIYLAGTDNHLLINESGVLKYQKEPEDYPHKPSVNVLFESVASNWKGQAVGVLLTGMGKDGAAGLLSMRDRGFYTLAQDEKSCAVYGMPKTAVQMDAVESVLPLEKISAELCQYFKVTNNSQVALNE